MTLAHCNFLTVISNPALLESWRWRKLNFWLIMSDGKFYAYVIILVFWNLGILISAARGFRAIVDNFSLTRTILILIRVFFTAFTGSLWLLAQALYGQLAPDSVSACQLFQWSMYFGTQTKRLS